jgi:tetratricopeptide (TPR) repeat protein
MSDRVPARSAPGVDRMKPNQPGKRMGSRPQPPQAGARSARLSPADHRATPRLHRCSPSHCWRNGRLPLHRKRAERALPRNPVPELRDKARARVAPLVGLNAEHSYGYQTGAQIALDELEELLTDDEINNQMTERRIVDLVRDVENIISEGLQKFPLNAHILALQADYLKLMQQHGKAAAALTKAFTVNPRQEWIAIRLARMLDDAGRHEDAKGVLARCLQDNPNSRRVHFEMAMLYMSQPSEAQRSLILDHLRRSFTIGDQN